VNWMSQRACFDVPVELFFPDVGQNASAAKAICASCPVVAECLSYALENREEYGVWGGLAPWERRPRQRPPKRSPVARCGTDAGYARHRRLGEEPCGECKGAHAKAWRLRNPRLAVVR
jgi:hypothetical protein